MEVSVKVSAGGLSLLMNAILLGAMLHLVVEGYMVIVLLSIHALGVVHSKTVGHPDMVVESVSLVCIV